MFIVHIRSHIKLPGHLTKENNLADALVNFALAEDEHQHLHTNAPHLHVQLIVNQSHTSCLLKGYLFWGVKLTYIINRQEGNLVAGTKRPS